jgi:hypothetical protein
LAIASHEWCNCLGGSNDVKHQRWEWPSKQCVCLFHLPANGIAMRCRRFMKNTVPLQELAETHNNGPALSGFPQQKSQGFQWTYASYAVFSCMEMHTFSTSQHQMVSLLQVVLDLSRCWRFQSPQRVTGDHLPNRNGHHGHHMTIKKGYTRQWGQFWYPVKLGVSSLFSDKPM